jgi:hypothetical protein
VKTERVLELKIFFRENIVKYGNPMIRGAVTLCFINTNNYHLIDGQHRYIALCELLDERLILPDTEIMFQFIRVTNEKELHEEFKNINRSVPVPIHYLEMDEAIPNAVELIKRRYPKFLSDKTACKRPSINIDKFKDALVESKITDDVFKITEDASQVGQFLYTKLTEFSEMYSAESVDFFLGGVKGKKLIESTKSIYGKYHKQKEKFMAMGLYQDCNMWINEFKEFVNETV